LCSLHLFLDKLAALQRLIYFLHEQPFSRVKQKLEEKTFVSITELLDTKLLENPKRTDHSEYLGVYGRIILSWILKK